MKEKFCIKCLYLIQTWDDEFKCIHPNNEKKDVPSKINKDKDCPWYEKSPVMIL